METESQNITKFVNAFQHWPECNAVPKIGPKRFHQNRIVSWLTSIPRSRRRSSTLRSDSGKRTDIIAARRMISAGVVK